MAELVRGSEADRVAQAQEEEEEEQPRGVRVRDAGGCLRLMSLPLDGADDDDATATIAAIFRDVPSRESLGKIADVCNLVLLLQDALLPSLRRVPADAAHLLIMDACAHKLREHARAVGAGGSFGVACAEFARRIDSYTAGARGHPGNTTTTTEDVVVASLRGSVDDLVSHASGFLDMTCANDEAAAAAAAEAQEA